MEIRDSFGEFLPGLGLERTRDALAKYVEIRWPYGRRKAVMKEWDLNEDEARSVISGRASWATWDKIVNHHNGRWAVIFPVYGALFDEAAEHFIQARRKAHADHAERLGALVGDWWPLGADRNSFDPNRDRRGDQRDGTSPHRAAEGARRQAGKN